MKTLKTVITFMILNSTLIISSNAQIVYTDLIPDSSYAKTSSSQSAGGSKAISFDINGDAFPDVKITIDSHRFGTFPNFNYASSVTVKTFNSTKIAVADSGNNSAGMPLALAANAIIKNQTWKSFNTTSGILNNGTFGSGGSNSCLWQNTFEKYLGVRLVVNGNKYYGWIRLTTIVYYNPIHSASGTIKDFAYDSTPNHSIHAGATSGARLADKSLINNLRKILQHETDNQFAQNNSLGQNQSNVVSRLSNAAPYAISWTKTIGGNNIDRNDYIGKTIASASGGGYLSMANTLSDNLSGYHGDVDILATRISSNGTVLWQKCYGGSGDDELHSVIKTSDNGFLIMGFTSSEDGDVYSFNHGNYDLWVVKINDTGTIQWEKCFGGTDVEFLASGLQNNDGSFMITTNTLSNDGDVTGNHGDFDIWLLKLDSNGNLLWQKSYGGSGGDYVDGLGIIKTQGVGYVLNGDSYSYLSDGDLSGAGFHQPIDPSTDDDAWFVKIDNVGNIQWTKCFGGEGSDWFRYITQFGNGDFVGTGGTIGSGSTGDMPGSYGDYDWWVARFSTTGNLNFSRHYGGTLQETIHNQALELPNGEIILPSGTNSNDFDVSANTAAKALWIMKTDADGNFINDNIIGRAGYNQMGGTVLNADGSLTINSMIDTTNISGDAEFVDAYADVLVIKLNPVAVSNHEAQLYNSLTGITNEICTNANSIKLNLRVSIPQGFVSLQGVTVKWYKNNNLVSIQNIGSAGFTGAYGKTIYKSLTVPKLFGLGDGTYKAKISYDYKTNLFSNYHQKNIGSNNVNIDFNNTCGAKLADENSQIETNNDISLTAFPNPLSNSTTISFFLSQSQNVCLKISDMKGRLIKTLANNIFEKGNHQIEFNAKELNAGIYFLQMQAGEVLKTEKLIITK